MPGISEPADVRRTIALSLTGDCVPAWFAAAVRELDTNHSVRLVGFRSPAPSARRAATSLVLATYDALDRLAFPVTHDACAPVDMRSAFPRLTLVDEPPLASTILSPDLPGESQARALASRVQARWIVCRVGEAGAMAGAPEILSRAPSLPFSIEQLGADGRTVLTKGAFALHPLSARRSVQHAYSKLASVLARVALDSRAASTTPPDSGRASALSAWSLVSAVGKYAYGRRLDAVFDWSLGIGRASSAASWRDAARATMTPLFPPPGHFWADPFPIVFEGRAFVFFEDFDGAKGRGLISAMELRDGAPVGAPQVVLETSSHLSYPFLLEHRDKLFMIPESSAARSVAIYECTRFPDQWAQVGELLSGVSAVDATVHEDDRGWWMFASLAPEHAPNIDQLSIFHAESPLGPWRPHKLNPVKTDVVGSRPAGKLFVEGGALLRPAQDCSFVYGRAIVMNEITRLTSTEFEERPVGRIDATWMPGLRGCHTFNRAADLVVTDGLVRRRR